MGQPIIAAIAFLSFLSITTTVALLKQPATIAQNAVAIDLVNSRLAKSPRPTPDITKNCAADKIQLTKAEIAEILRLHNQARAQVGTPSLTWNCKLATEAQNWVDKGVYRHSSKSYGENLAAAAPGNGAVVTKGTGLWLNEKKYWNNKTATCQSGKQCGHYTQMVWKSTTQIGCGLNRKTSIFPGFAKNSAYLTCLYDPAGNYPGPAY